MHHQAALAAIIAGGVLLVVGLGLRAARGFIATSSQSFGQKHYKRPPSADYYSGSARAGAVLAGIIGVVLIVVGAVMYA